MRPLSGHEEREQTLNQLLVKLDDLDPNVGVILMAAPLEGRAAEGLIFSSVSTGAHNDLARAKDTARSMVKEYAMSTRLGKVCFAHKRPVASRNAVQEIKRGVA